MPYSQTVLAFELSKVFVAFIVDISFYMEYSSLYLIAASTLRHVWINLFLA